MRSFLKTSQLKFLQVICGAGVMAFASMAISAQGQAKTEKEIIASLGEGDWNVNNETTNPKVGSSEAVKGGSIVFATMSYPKSVNYMISGDNASAQIWELVTDFLCDTNMKTGEVVPVVAEKWHISKDKMTYTFFLDKNAKYHDGRPILAKDVKLYWDIVQDKKNLVGAIRSAVDNKFESFKVLSDRVVQFKAKKAHFSNLETACEFTPLDSKFYAGKDFNKAFNNKIVGSGPYSIESTKKGHKIVFKRNKNYWGANLPHNFGRYNFDTITFRNIDDDSIRYELFKKGEIELFEFNVAKRWKTETDSEKFKKNWVIARRVDNEQPRGFSGSIFNMRRDIFKDVKVREAITLTYNRDRFIKDLFYDNYTKLGSYFPNSIWENKSQEPYGFDLKKARALLSEAGWTKVNNEGYLIKDGKVFQFEYLYTSKSSERFLTIWKDDLRKIGVKLNLSLTTWPTMVKNWSNYNFDMAGVAWTTGLNPDPFVNWHSSTVNEPSGNNLPGYQNKQVDEWIESLAGIFDRNERAKIFQKIDAELYKSHPYILGWFLDHGRIGYWNKLGAMEKMLPRFQRTDRVYQWVWHDADKEKALKTAMKANKALPADPKIKGPSYAKK